MKKITTIIAVAFAVVGSATAQMVIPGETFAKNPASFNGRNVSIKNIQITASTAPVAGVVGPVTPATATPMTVAPGPAGASTVPTRCNPPRGFKQLDVDFLAAPGYQGCFFMGDAMFTDLARHSNGKPIDVQITFRGDSRVGYNVTFYRIGR